MHDAIYMKLENLRTHPRGKRADQWLPLEVGWVLAGEGHEGTFWGDMDGSHGGLCICKLALG